MTDLLDSPASMNDPAAAFVAKNPLHRTARNAWRLASLPVIIFCALLGAYAFWLNTRLNDLPTPHALGVFWLCFGWNESVPLFLLTLFGVIALRPPANLYFRLAKAGRWMQRWMLAERLPLFVALAVFVVAAVGTFAVCMNHPLSMDEYTMDYQAQVFASGKLAQPVPKAWLPEAELVRPVFCDFNDDNNTWSSAYLPVYSALRALFTKVDLPFLMNPLLVALSIPFFLGTLRSLWPGERWLHHAGILLLAVGSQFMLNGMTAFPLTAHLFLNILWVYCYTKPNRQQWLWCPWIGFAAIGLHQPFMHALFVLPFLLHWTLTRPLKTTIYCALVYLAACLTWHQWWVVFANENAEAGASAFAFKGWLTIHLQSLNTALILSWTTALVPSLALYAIFRRRLSSLLIAAAGSVALTCIFYWFYPENQGHGWGFRYFFSALGSLLLIACAGLRAFQADFGKRRAQTLLASMVILSAGLLALRCFQVRSITEPYVAVSAYLEAQKADMVIVDASSIWYGADFVRNRPDLTNRPILVLAPMKDEQVKDLMSRGTVKVVKGHDLVPLSY
jgi:hypothetical protein